MADRRVTFIISANIKNFTKGLDSAQKQFTSFGKSMQRVGSTLTTSISAPLAGLGALAISQAAKFEKLRTSMNALNGSVEEGGRNFERLKRFSAVTPFQLEDLASAQNMLQGFGLSADVAFTSLKQIGDIAAITGGDISGIGIAFGQAAAEGRLMTRDVRQLINQGVPAIKLLAETMGVAESQVLDLASQGKISFEILQQAFANATMEGGLFANGMEKQSQTIAGVFSTLKDNVSLALGELGETIFKELNLKEVLQNTIKAIQGAVVWFKNLSTETKRTILVIGGLVTALGPALVALGLVATAIGAISAPVLLVIGALAALSAAVLYVSDNWDAIVERISDWSWWRNALIDMAQFFIEYSPISLFIKGYQELAKLVGIDLPNPFTDMANALDVLKVDTKDYEHEFGSFTDAVVNGAKKVQTSLSGLLPTSSGAAETSTSTGGGGGQKVLSPFGEGANFSGISTVSIIPPDLVPGITAVDNALQAMGGTIESLPERAQPFIDNVALLRDNFREAWMEGERFGAHLGDALGTLFTDTASGIKALANTVIGAIKRIVAGFLAKALAAAIAGAFASSGNPIVGAVLAAAGTGLVYGLFNAIPGFAQGGVVPEGYPNDTFLARLSSGETITPRGQTLPGGMMAPIRVTGTLRGQGDELLAVIEEAEYQRGNTN